MRVSKFIYAAMWAALSWSAYAADPPVQPISDETCVYAGNVYKVGAVIKTAQSIRDPLTRKTISVEDPNGIRLECVPDNKYFVIPIGSKLGFKATGSMSGSIDGSIKYHGGTVTFLENDDVVKNTLHLPSGSTLTCRPVEVAGGYATHCQVESVDRPRSGKWNELDKVVDGKLIPGPGYKNFVASAPIGTLQPSKPEEKERRLKAGLSCNAKEGETSLGGIIEGVSSNRIFRCVGTFDERLQLKAAEWVELVKRNGEWVTTP